MAASTGIRIPDDLKDEIQKHGEANGRNFTAEVIYLLMEALKLKKEEEQMLAEAKAMKKAHGIAQSKQSAG